MVDTPADDVGDVELGPAPRVQGRERIRAGIRAKLFGDGDPSMEDTDVGDSPPGRSGSHGEDPERIGRFKVLKRLGSGGMGVVYSAYDPELDRKVAIKLLRPDLIAGLQGSSGTSRLQREAQAMARLNHPHVATVHEVGTHEEQVFVAMEFVDGGTLREWLETERPHAEVLTKYIDAGSGLAAAHAAGIVHRDFKPDNVMIDREGRVRVMDFGLSRAHGVGELDGTAEGSSTTLPRDIDPMATPLTETGAIMGTPAYMAPEQHQGRAADERSDQFTFCVSLYEGLCGVRPFEGKTYPELVANVVAGKIRPAPSGVPRRLLGVIERGLAVDPAERYPSMDDLLAELRADPARVWRIGGVVAALMAVASGVTWAATRDESAVSADACADQHEQLAGIWDAQRAEAVHAALLATGATYAEPVWTSTQRLLDRYAQEWAGASEELCAARLVAADPDEVGYVRRRRCLDARKAELGQLVELLTGDGEALALQAVHAAVTLSEVTGCADAQKLQSWSVREDAASTEAHVKVREDLARAKASGALGQYKEAIEIASAATEAARGLDDPAVMAEGLLVRGQYLERAGRIEEAEASLRDAVRQAEIGGDHVTRALALIRLVYVVGAESQRVAEARALGADAAAVLRVVGADRLLAAKLDMNLGAVAKVVEEYEVAIEHYRRALDANLELFGPDHPETARAYANLGSPLSRLERPDEAEEYLLRGLESFKKTLGPDHPNVAIVLNNLGNNKARNDRFEEAIPYLKEALRIRESTLGPDHNRVASTRYNLGKVLFNAGRFEESKPVLVAAAAGMREASPNDPRMPVYLVHQGVAQLFTGETEAGRAALREAIIGFRDRGDRQGIHVRTAHYHLAASLLVDNPREARRLTEIGLEMAGDLERNNKGFAAQSDVERFGGLLWLLDANEMLSKKPPTRPR